MNFYFQRFKCLIAMNMLTFIKYSSTCSFEIQDFKWWQFEDDNNFKFTPFFVFIVHTPQINFLVNFFLSKWSLLKIMRTGLLFCVKVAIQGMIKLFAFYFKFVSFSCCLKCKLSRVKDSKACNANHSTRVWVCLIDWDSS